MWISNLSIKRPVFATMIIMSFMVLGAVSMTRLGVDLFPDVNFPFVSVTVVYPGASPEDVETQITRKVEDAIAGINGVKRVESDSRESMARVAVELHLEVDPQAAAAEVREKVAAIRDQLPRDIEDPTVQRFDVAALPVMVYAVGSTEPSDVTRRLVEDKIKPLLEQVEGVAAVEVNGGEVREIKVELDPRRLEALQLPVAQVAERLAMENVDVPAGTVDRDGRTIALRTKGEFDTAAEIDGVILRSAGGSPVHVHDVGRVVDGYAERRSTTRLNGVDAVSFAVRKQSGANTVEVARRVRAALDRLAPDFGQLRFGPVQDDSEFIRENVAEVRRHIVFGGLMAVLVVFLFMRDWRSTVITALALPTSVIATFFFMYVAGFTINMMTLMALSLVIGILIDDAVVVRESIYRHLEHGEDMVTAARNGTAAIGLAVMATTLTILAVFLPVGFMTGLVGQFFKSFALTIAFAVSMSLLVAFTLDPMLSSRFVRYISPEERSRTRVGRVLERWGRAYDRLDLRYQWLLGHALDRPWTVLAVAAVIFVASLGSLAVIGTEFVPEEDRSEFNVIIDLPPGTSFDESVARISEIERLIQGDPDVTQIFSTVGVLGETRSSVLRVKVTKKGTRPRTIGTIKADMRQRLANLPFVEAKVVDPEFMQGVPYQAPVTVFLRGDDLGDLQRLSDELVARARQVPGAVDVSSSLVAGQPEMVARVNRALAADLGFSVGAISQQMRGMVEGIVPSRLRDGDREVDIRVRLSPEYRADFSAIARAPLYSATGAAIRTGDVVRLEPAVGPSTIHREQRRRQATVGINLDGSRPLGDVTRDVEAILADMRVPAGFSYGFSGDVEMMQESASALLLAMILAIAFIYIVLASQFESFLEPVLIMVSLPLAIVGALLLLLATGHHLGMPAMIGMVMLTGLVTKNAILLVDCANQAHREDGLPIREALLKAGPMRLRPILMTTLAMILGMLPSALGTGDGGEFRAPISIATIGGLITSTLLTLVVVPAGYLLMHRGIARVRAWRTGAASLHPALRVAGMLVLAAILGGLVAVASAFGEPVAAADQPERAQAPLVLTFDQALELALRQNPGFKVSRERVREAEGRVRQARTRFYPTADLSFLYTPAQEFPKIVIPGGIFGPDEQVLDAAFTRQNIMRVDLTQPLYTGGRLKNAERLEQAGLDGERLTESRTRQELSLRVVEAFYRSLLQDQGVRVAEQGVALAEQQLGVARARFESGSAARFDVLRAEVDVANARTTLIRARSARDIAAEALRTVLAVPAGTPLRLEGSLDEIESLPGVDQLLTALPARPDLGAIGARQQMAERAVDLATGEMKPSLALAGNVQYQEDNLTRLTSASNRSFAVGFALQVPLAAAPGARARRATAQAQVKQAQFGLTAALDAGRLEVLSAHTEWVAAREIVETQQKALDLARESLAIAQVSYENGLITQIELADARQSLLESEWGLMQARFGQILAAAKTRYAAGI